MTAFFVLVIFTLPNTDEKTLHKVRSALLKTGLEDVILGSDERNYTLPNNHILAGEFMARTAGQCRKILYKKIDRVLQDMDIPEKSNLVIGVCSQAEWFIRESFPKRQVAPKTIASTG